MAKTANRDDWVKKNVESPPKYGLVARGAKTPLNLYEVDGELLRDVIARVTLEGDAVLFGMTRDQTALKLQLLTDHGTEEVYAGTLETLEGHLRVIRDAPI